MKLTIPLDKQAHALSGMVLVFVVHGLTQSLPWSLGVCGLAAIAKEIYDLHYPDTHSCDVWDAIATCVGGSLAALFVIGVRLYGG